MGNFSLVTNYPVLMDGNISTVVFQIVNMIRIAYPNVFSFYVTCSFLSGQDIPIKSTMAKEDLNALVMSFCVEGTSQKQIMSYRRCNE